MGAAPYPHERLRLRAVASVAAVVCISSSRFGAIRGLASFGDLSDAARLHLKFKDTAAGCTLTARGGDEMKKKQCGQ